MISKTIFKKKLAQQKSIGNFVYEHLKNNKIL